MSKNLQTVQKISKVLGVISKVLYVIAFVLLILSIVGTVVMAVFCAFPEISEKIVLESGRSMRQIIGYCVAGIVTCIVHLIVTKAHKDYFLMEQQAGTPFTAEGAKAFRTLGIMNLVAPVVCFVLVAIVEVIFGNKIESNYEMEMGLGIAMILISFVFAYGAEIEEKK